MKIVIDARESGTSTGRYHDKLIEHLHKLKPDHDITILTRPHRLTFFGGIAPNFVAVPTQYKEFTFGEQLGFLRQINSLEPDLVHFGMVQQPIFYQGKIVTSIADLTTVRFKNPSKNPVVFWVKQQVYKFVMWLAPRKSRFVLTISNYVKSDLVNFAKINPDKVIVTYLAADKIKDKPEPVEGLEKTPFIMYVGRPLPHKNLPRLVEAFKVLKAKHPDLKLVIGGGKHVLMDRVEESVKQQGIKDVIFTGFVSEGQLRWMYENCAAYVVPSLSEGFGLPGLEAMLHGAPVVSSNTTCLPEIYKEAALYFDPLDINAMALAIDGVLTTPNLRKKLIERGRLWATEYSWDKTAKQTLEVYEKALEQ